MPLEEWAGRLIGAAKRYTPPGARSAMAATFDAATDFAEAILRRTDPLTPPLRIRLHIGPFADARLYRASADRNLEALHELGGLLPSSRVLDIGCGCGRIAAALTRRLSADGSYDGFDVARAPVEWCQRAITSRFPNFRFVWADTFSRRYNPASEDGAPTSRFPYPDNQFDLVFAGSVYTHMLPDEVAQYLRETNRVLKPGGRSLSTFCLLNDQSLPIVKKGRSSPVLPHPYRECQVRDLHDPASFIAQPEELIRILCQRAGLRIREPVVYGSWASEAPKKAEVLERYGFEQDIVVAEKP